MSVVRTIEFHSYSSAYQTVMRLDILNNFVCKIKQRDEQLKLGYEAFSRYTNQKTKWDIINQRL